MCARIPLFAGYIFGGNTVRGEEKAEKVAMTAPVRCELWRTGHDQQRDSACKLTHSLLTELTSVGPPTLSLILLGLVLLSLHLLQHEWVGRMFANHTGHTLAASA